MLAELFSILAPIYVCAGLGALWIRLGRRYDTEMITELISQIGAPCLVFSSLVTLEMDPAALVQMMGATLAALACFATVGALVLGWVGLPRTTFLPPVVFGNTGNLGLPLCLFAFGDEGLALGIVFFATTTIVHLTLGQFLWAGEVSLGRLVRTPLAWAALLAAAVLWGGLEVPGWLVRSTSVIGSFTIPLMQFTLGVSLAQLGPGRIGRGLGLTALRMGTGVAVGFGGAALLGLEGVARGVFVLDCAMPVAVINYLLAQQHGRAASEVAGLVVLSTFVSFATIPLLLAVLLPD